MKIIKLKEIDSTHKLALRMIESDSAFECGIIADIQTNGVGRCERKWESASGNLYSSIIKKIPPNVDICKISLATACAVHEAVKNLLDPEKKEQLYLHWPNDIYYKNKKLSGILLAAVEDWVVISIGINIHSVLTPTAVSLDSIVGGFSVSAQQLFDSVLNKLNTWLNLLQMESFSGIREYWLRNITGMDSEVTIKNGRDRLSGIIRGIDELGRLILEYNGQTLYISSGDMFINEKEIMVNYD